MGNEQRLEAAIAELSMKTDTIWLATKLSSDFEGERGSWPSRINIHIRFFRALKEAGCGDGIRVDLVSHKKSGSAVPRYVRQRVFLEWDVEAESFCPDGVWGSFTICALVLDEISPRLWCWICDSIEEEEYAKAMFNWWEPQSFALAKGLPLFPERIGLLKGY